MLAKRNDKISKATRVKKGTRAYKKEHKKPKLDIVRPDTGSGSLNDTKKESCFFEEEPSLPQGPSTERRQPPNEI